MKAGQNPFKDLKSLKFWPAQLSKKQTFSMPLPSDSEGERRKFSFFDLLE